MTALIIALLVTGAALLAAEAHVTSYGVLGVSGIVALALGGLLAMSAAGVGVVRREIASIGDVQVAGELWRARRSWADDEPAFREGEHVVVEAVHGLTLSVRRAEEWEVMP